MQEPPPATITRLVRTDERGRLTPVQPERRTPLTRRRDTDCWNLIESSDPGWANRYEVPFQ